MNVMVTRSGRTIKTVPKKIIKGQIREFTPSDSPPLVRPSSVSPGKQSYKAAKNRYSWGNLSIITRYDLILKGTDIDFCGDTRSTQTKVDRSDERLPPFTHEVDVDRETDILSKSSETFISKLAEAIGLDKRVQDPELSAALEND
ncbi:MAG: hypothetical protein MJA29_13790, partial [Candidatus Omnitrophica bacterium]|nr:hypothetical protein [Candidatus Omnitrophota bacterium]